MGEIIPFRPHTPALPFRWRDQHGKLHSPILMGTRHLYFTVVMIWNHTMPYEARTHNYKEYRFGPFYSPSYLETAIRWMLPEVLRRHDLERYQILALLKMNEYLMRNRLISGYPEAETGPSATRLLQELTK